METIIFLIIFPLIAALVLAITKHEGVRGIIVRSATLVLAGAAISVATEYFYEPYKYYIVNSELINYGILFIEFIMALYIIYIGIKNKKRLIVLLAFLQTSAMMWFELGGSHSNKAMGHHLFIDKLTIIMILIIAIVGGLICIFAISYMKEYHNHHKEVEDRQRLFFILLFVFLSAMFGIVISDDLVWIYLFWEVTTLCSFLLIGYTKTKEAKNNSFLALLMNLIGGLCFAGAIIYLGLEFGITELRDVLTMNLTGFNLIIPAILLSIAGLSKAAQLPFSKWLLGAMVAPTPTSALLHSSTMVKAGVYLLIRISPLLVGNIAGYMVIVIGGITFLLMSFVAISQSDGKKVLAYSTMANLGLIVACAGAGNPQAIWAAIMIIIFHSVSKSLMFLSVGAAEQVIGSRDIEDMHGLIVRLPEMALFMSIGICGMFLAPFGMLISKWAALKAFVDSKNAIIIFMLVYGSAATLFYWTKWLGKIAAVLPNSERLKFTVKPDEWVSLSIHGIFTVGLCVLFPFVSKHMIIPILYEMFMVDSVNIISSSNQQIMVISLVLILLIPFVMRYFTSRHEHVVTAYMGGINEGDNKHFSGAIDNSKKMYLSSWYMKEYFGEDKILPLGTVLSVILIIGALALTIGGAL